MNQRVKEQVEKAYADCLEGNDLSVSSKIRELEFRATEPVNKYDAESIMESCNVFHNDFEPAVFKEFPEDSEIFIARESSVCIYLKSNEIQNDPYRGMETWVNILGRPDEFTFNELTKEYRLWWD